MFRLLWAANVRIRYFLRRHMPTNILLDLIRTRRGLKWSIPAMLLAAPYLLAASICTSIIEDGGPGWLNLLVLLFIWNALKFLVMGPSASPSCSASASRRAPSVAACAGKTTP